MPEADPNPRPRCCRWVAAAAGAAGLYLLWRHRRCLTVRSVATGEGAAYPEVLAQVFAHAPAKVRGVAVEAVESLHGWSIASAEETAIHARAPLAPLGGAAGLAIRFTPLMDGRLTRVDIASASLGRRPDHGGNARAVRAFQARMRCLLPSEGAPHAG
ncbi:MAG: DUF1499 domain-containing protein [Armatimonadetes bacterium]|nr:DUF1499 domain-containing protein [Armatimonadota bacterium]